MRAPAIRGASVLAAGNVAGQLCALVRNAVIARAIGPGNFGLAATFLVTVSLLEMISDLSLDKMILQAKDGDGERLQACAQFLQAIRGVCMSILLLVLAWPIAMAFDAPHAVWAYRMLALLPLIRGFMHLDVKRYQRAMRFTPFAIVELVPQFIGLGAAIVLVIWIHDYAVALWIILAQAAVMVVLSHLWAGRSYRWAIDRDAAGRFFHFGWPLVLNGLLLWIATQADRAVVGSLISKESLGFYAATLSLLIIPAMLLQRVFGQVGLPALAPMQDAPEDFSRRYRVLAEAYVAAVLMIFVSLSIATPTLVSLVYGQEFSIAPAAVSLLVVAAALRCMRGIPTLAALSLAKTRTVMVGNLVRAGGLPVIILCAMYWKNLTAVAGALCLIEAVSLVAVWVLVRRFMVVQKFPPAASMPIVIVVALIGGSALATAWFPALGPVNAILLSALSFIVAGLGAVAFLPRLRGLVLELRAGAFT